MKLKIEWIETKSPDWKIATLRDESGISFSDASINRTDKKGRIFPNFDGLMAGHTIEANPWQNPTTKKWAIYPEDEVKVATTSNFGGSRGVSKLMDKKAENIKEAQERKAESIAFFNSTNSAIALVNAMRNNDVHIPSESELKVTIRAWRDWFLKEYEDWNKGQPF